MKKDTARRLNEATEQAASWIADRDRLIRKAMNEGASSREVAEIADMSHTSVLKIWRDARDLPS